MGSDIGYQLERGSTESSRLTAQHFLAIARQGFLLHPEIQSAISNTERVKIADVATGTGIWASDVAQNWPQADVVGLDISDAMYPPEWTWPKNLSLGVYDILQETPPQFKAAFDVVHVRLLLPAGPQIGHYQYLAQLTRMLKPGGWLQLDEVGWPASRLISKQNLKAVPLYGSELPPMPEQFQFMKFRDWSGRLELINDFEAIAAKAEELEHARRFEMPIDQHLLKAGTSSNLAVWTNVYMFIKKTQADQNSQLLAELEEALQTMAQYEKKGILLAFDWNICIARRKVSY